MKKTLLILALSITGFVNGQTKTNDVELKSNLNIINQKAKEDLKSIKNDWVNVFHTTIDKIDKLFSHGLEPSDVFMNLELSRVTKKPIDEVFKVYQSNKEQGWGVIAKKLGIKPGSEAFHELKRQTGKHASKTHGKKNKHAQKNAHKKNKGNH